MPLACTADPGNAAPVIGFTDVCEVEFDVRDERHARPRGSARHPAVHRRAVGGDRRARRARSTRELAAHDVRLTQGGEPTFVSVDDMDGAGVELHGAVAEEARARPRSCCGACARRFAPRRVAALRAGQVVSGRAAAALGARRLLARRRQAAVARRRADRRHARRRARPTSRRRRRSRPRSRRGSGLPRDYVITALRGRAGAPRRRGGAAGQRRSAGGRPRRSRTSARASRACCGRDSTGPAGFVLPLQARRRGRTRPSRWHSSPWPLRRERLYALRRRFAARAAAAARLAAGRAARRTTTPIRRRSVRAARERCRPATRGRRRRPAGAPRARRRAARGRSRPRCASRCATATCTCSCRRSTRLEDYVALLARDRGRRPRRCGTPVAIEGYTPPRDPRAAVLDVTPDPGVIEVNIHPASSLGRADRAPPRRSTRRRGSRGSAPRSSCSTAGTPAPAAATTSRWAARRPPTARCCAGPTCCAA